MPNETIQQQMIEKLRRMCASDPDLEAAMLYGSFPLGEADKYSDIDCILYFKNDRLPSIDPQTWVSQLAPLLLFYRNEFGNWAAVFENLVRGEFHFYPQDQMAALPNFKGTIWFPSATAAVLVDKNGELAGHLQALCGERPERDPLQDLQYQTNSFCNWILFGANVFARGEHARALEILRLVQDALLRLVRLQEDSCEHWINPTRQLENELSSPAYRQYQACTAALQPGALALAYRNSWTWGVSLLKSLHEQFNAPLPSQLISALEQPLIERLGG